MKPDEFWTGTLRELYLIAKFYENDQNSRWQRTRNIEFAQYNVQYNAMNGKKIFKNLKKPRDLYELPSDGTRYVKDLKIDVLRQKLAIEQMKATTNYRKWRKS